MDSEFTSKYKLNKLVYISEFSNVIETIASEKRIKGWKRYKKEKLITSYNPKWINLAT